MKPQEIQAVLDKIVGQIFGYKNPFTVEQFMQKYAFDVRLPQRVSDSTTGEETWTQSPNPTKFIAVKNAWDRQDWDNRPKRGLNSIQDILTAWNEVNFTATDRHLDSIILQSLMAFILPKMSIVRQTVGAPKTYYFPMVYLILSTLLLVSVRKHPPTAPVSKIAKNHQIVFRSCGHKKW